MLFNKTLEDKNSIIRCIVTHFCISVRKGELDQLISGLDSMGISQLLRFNANAFRHLFKMKKSKLTSSLIQDLIAPQFSVAASNRREKEDQAFFFWVTFLSEFDESDNVLLETGTEEMSLTLEDILVFLTGSSEIPIMGFDPKPAMEFTENSVFPMASTCSNTLILPLGISDYDRFKYNMGFGIINSPGFLRL
jgi:hypothetical protein